MIKKCVAQQCSKKVVRLGLQYCPDHIPITCHECVTLGGDRKNEVRCAKHQKSSVLMITDVPSRHKLLDSITTTFPPTSEKNIMYAGFVATLYLTGARVSEVVGVLRTSDIDLYEEDGIQWLKFSNIPTLKKRTRTYLEKKLNERVSIIPYKAERPFCALLEAWLEYVGEGDVVFSRTRQWGHYVCAKLDAFPHAFRSIRMTHLSHILRDPMVQARYFNLTSLDVLERYYRGGLEVVKNHLKNLEEMD